MQQVKTISLIEEIKTDGHSPLKFLCDDLNIYYCKYRSGSTFKKEEIDCLFYEIVCNNLLTALGIVGPNLAIVEIANNSFMKRQLLKATKDIVSLVNYTLVQKKFHLPKPYRS